ncbi:unnamed protein product [Polarella glacialis]|uniref:Pyroglutamyl-peptidase I n=1 Tax=Polarella glacialis TaxID=89957 RepID=A0A813K5Z4_POLGL|nr:unnamed protein product [Polarella glacialis]
MFTALPITELFCKLKDAGVDCEISDSAGTYICNYIYFKSLLQAANSGACVLFVHTPDFRTVPEEQQVKAMEELLKAIADLASRGRF